MSYERLELIDGVTKWDTEKVQHLEDAIIKNENDIQKYHNDTVVEMQADWDQNDETAKDYIKNRPFYVEHSTVEPYEPIYHPIDEKFIPDTIAKVTDIPVMDITLTNEGAAADAKAVGEAISNLENKVDNKQIEEYFEEVIGTETLIGSSSHGESIEVRPALFDRPINLKLVNKLSGKIFILKDEDFSGGRGEFNYEGPADLSFGIRFSGENVTFFEKGVNDSAESYDLYKIEFKTLDEKYISNTIVRKTELEEYFYVYEEELYVNSFEERMIGFLGQFLNEVKRPIRLKFVNTLTGEIQIVKEKDLNITYEGPSGGPTYEVITYNNPNGLIVQQFSMSSTDILLEYFHGQCDDIVVYGLIPIDDKKELNEEYIPDTIARAPKATFDDIEEAPTASDFNTLLSILREAGILATE